MISLINDKNVFRILEDPQILVCLIIKIKLQNVHAFIEKCNTNTNNCYITDMPGGKWVDRSRYGDNTEIKSKIETHIEFFDNDLQNIPLNKNINITINFKGSDVEVYYDDKIIKQLLNGRK